MDILAIGNSFSQDATTYLHQVARRQGKKITAESLVYPGCSLKQHFRFMKADAKAYQLFFNGQAIMHKISLAEALADRKWDIVTVQQASGYAPNYETYQPYLNEIVAFVRKMQPQAKIYIHQTWAYEEGSDLLLKNTVFRTRKEMFENIKKSYENAFGDIDADGIIPSGQTFENLAEMGMKYHRDSMHASLGIGRYALALTWLKTLTDTDISQNDFSDFDEEVSKDEIKKIKQAVNKTFE